MVYAVAAALIYAILGCVIKVTEKKAPIEMAVFFRQVVSLITIMPFIAFGKNRFSSLKTTRFPLHFLRAFTSLAAMYCLFYTLKYLPLVDALLLSYTRPLFIPIVVFIWYRKPWTRATWLGLITGFLGVALILKPDKKMFDIAAFIGLASACFGAVSFTSIRRLTRTEHSNTILFYYFILSLPVAALPLVSVWRQVDLIGWGLFAIIGILGTLYQATLTRAYSHAKAHKVASALYSTVIFAAIFDWWTGDFSLDYFSFIGMVLIFIGTLITIRQKKTPYPPEGVSKT